MSEKTRAKSPVRPKKTSTGSRCSSTAKKKRGQRRHVQSSSSTDEEDKIDESIRSKALRNNLTEDNVLDIIRNVVSSEFVLEAVKQRADQIENHIQQEKDRVRAEVQGCSDDVGKMTRKRARELNKTPLKIPDLNQHLDAKSLTQNQDTEDNEWESKSDEESVDDDEEYVPTREEWLESEDCYISTKRRSAPKQSKKPAIVVDHQANQYNPEMEGDEYWLDFLEKVHEPEPPEKAAEEEKESQSDPEFDVSEALEKSGDDGEDHYKRRVTRSEAVGLLNDLLDDVEDNMNHELKEELTKGCEKIPLPPPMRIRTRIREGVPKVHIPKRMGPGRKPDVPRKEPKVMPPMEGVDPLGLVIPTPSLPPNFNLVHGSNNQLFLVPLTNEVNIQKPRRAFLEVDVNDPMPKIVSQINEQRIINYQLEVVGLNGWTGRLMRIFHRQLLSHVQLLGQLFVLTKAHPKFWKCARPAKNLLDDLMVKSKHSLVLSELCWNVKDMHVICEEWDRELNLDNEENTRYVVDLMEISYFHERVRKKILRNKAFMFPEFVPRIPPGYAKIPSKRPFLATHSMGVLIAFWMMQLDVKQFRYEEQQQLKEIFATRYPNCIKCKNLDRYWSGKLVYRNSVIWDYLKTGMVKFERPEMHLESYDDVVPLFHFYKSLPGYGRWKIPASMMLQHYHLEKTLRDNVRTRPPPPAPLATSITMDYENFQARIMIPEDSYVAVGSHVPEFNLDVSDDEEADKDAGVPGLISGWKKHSEKEVKQKKKRGKTGKRASKADLVRIIKAALNRKKREVQKPKTNVQIDLYRRRKRLTYHLHKALGELREEYEENVEDFEDNPIAMKLFEYFKEFDIFVRLFHQRMQMENAQDSQQLQDIINVDLPKSVVKNPFPDHPSDNGYEYDPLFAWKFIDAVGETLGRKDFSKFLETITGKKTEPQTVFDFYLKLEGLLSKDYSELHKIFLVHLMPRHLNHVGKFIEEMIFKDAALSVEYLNAYMDQRSIQMQLLYQQLTYLPKETSISVIAVKKQFMPSINGNQLVKDWFLQLIPDRRAASGDASLLQFSRYCPRILTPRDLNEFLEKRLIEQPEDGLPPMNLQLSSESEGDSDSVEFICEEIVSRRQSLECSNVSIYSQESEMSISNIGNDLSEEKPKVASTKTAAHNAPIMDTSITLTDHTDYTE